MAQCPFCRIRASNLMMRESAGSRRCSQGEYTEAVTRTVTGATADDQKVVDTRCSGKDGRCQVKFTRGSVFKCVECDDVALCARCFQSFDHAQHQFVHLTLDKHIPHDTETTPPTLQKPQVVRSDLLAQLLCRAPVPYIIQHIQRSHKSGKTARCNLCLSPQKFTAAEMVQHLREHHLPGAAAAPHPPPPASPASVQSF